MVGNVSASGRVRRVLAGIDGQHLGDRRIGAAGWLPFSSEIFGESLLRPLALGLGQAEPDEGGAVPNEPLPARAVQAKARRASGARHGTHSRWRAARCQLRGAGGCHKCGVKSIGWTSALVSYRSAAKGRRSPSSLPGEEVGGSAATLGRRASRAKAIRAAALRTSVGADRPVSGHCRPAAAIERPVQPAASPRFQGAHPGRASSSFGILLGRAGGHRAISPTRSATLVCRCQV